MKDGRSELCQQCVHPDQKGIHTCERQCYQPSEQIPNKAWPDSQRLFSSMQQATNPSPIKVLTVCTDQENGRYIAFLGTDPTKKATAFSRESATAQLLAEQKLIVMTEID